MYTGDNQTAIRSMKWIEESLIRLLENNQYKKITVKDICNEADLSRQTFYQMFDSREEVMEYHFCNLFLKFQKKCGDFRELECKDLTNQFYSFFYSERSFIRILIDNNMSFFLEQQFEQYLPQIKLFKMINETEKYPEYSVVYVAGALTQTLIYWFKNNFEPEISEVSKITEEIISGKVYQDAMKGIK